MAQVTCVQMTWKHQALTIPPVSYPDGDIIRRVKFFPIYVDPEPEYPVGRKGAIMAAAWQHLGAKGKADGMLVLDGDVAVDPIQVQSMFAAIDEDPVAVWTAPVRIWPISTHRQTWTWAHWDEQASQTIDENPAWFSFCFTYLPAALLTAAVKAGMRSWMYPRVDANMSRTAQRLGLAVRVVPECFPVHLHW